MSTSTRAFSSTTESTRITLGTYSPLGSMQLRKERRAFILLKENMQDSSLTLRFQINKESGQIKMSPVDKACTGISDSD